MPNVCYDGRTRTLKHYWWKYIMAQPLWKKLWQFLNNLITGDQQERRGIREGNWEEGVSKLKVHYTYVRNSYNETHYFV
jgi:hypothetical protein